MLAGGSGLLFLPRLLKAKWSLIIGGIVAVTVVLVVPMSVGAGIWNGVWIAIGVAGVFVGFSIVRPTIQNLVYLAASGVSIFDGTPDFQQRGIGCHSIYISTTVCKSNIIRKD